MNQALKQLEGKELAGITFIRSYLQLLFDDSYLNAYVWPQIKIGENYFNQESLDYRNILCQQIGKTISQALENEGERLVLKFSDESELEISLKDENRDGPEAVVLQIDGGKSWAVW